MPARLPKFLIIFFLLIIPYQVLSQTVERFPKPDFQTEYQRPDLMTPAPRSPVKELVDVFVLVVALSLGTYFALKQRSRRNIFLLMIFSLIYFGFYRKGCVCSIGAIQNVSLGLFDSGYTIPLTVIAFFMFSLITFLS